MSPTTSKVTALNLRDGVRRMKGSPPTTSEKDRREWIIANADFFTIIERRDRRYIREEFKTLTDADQRAGEIMAERPEARLLIYAVASPYDTLVRTVGTRT